MIEIIEKVYDGTVREKAIRRFREKGIILPTFAQMRNPELIPQNIKDKLKHIGLWDLDPLNLFRITWKNEPTEKGGGFGKVNYIELPSQLTGVKARIVLMIGKWFPTGAHKVGAAYGCLAPRIITGQFDPTHHKAVWPSTGNYCRGGAFDSYLMGCESVAILPEEMSRERFEWLREIGAEIFATPGCESNVKEIYDKCWDLRRNKPDYIILNQFDEFGNPVWHYQVTGPALEEIYGYIAGSKTQLAAYISNTGSAGTIAAGDYL
jgi:cysteine synthase